jgi:hypothetical protein
MGKGRRTHPNLRRESAAIKENNMLQRILPPLTRPKVAGAVLQATLFNWQIRARRRIHPFRDKATKKESVAGETREHRQWPSGSAGLASDAIIIVIKSSHCA